MTFAYCSTILYIFWLSCCAWTRTVHCKDKISKFRNKYSQKRNIGVSVPISTYMRLWVIYIFPRPFCLFCWREYVERSWDYINCSKTHECGNWGWGCAIPIKGIYKWDFHCSVHCTKDLNKFSHLMQLGEMGVNSKFLFYFHSSFFEEMVFAFWISNNKAERAFVIAGRGWGWSEWMPTKKYGNLLENKKEIHVPRLQKL